MKRCFQTIFLLSFVFISQLAIAEEKKTREQKVREDRQRVEAEGFWIYNDLQRGYDAARDSGKPILVVLRCIPCEKCVKLDDNLVDQDPVIRPLLDQFVCVRIVSTNGLDLSIFQFDTDQSFAAFNPQPPRNETEPESVTARWRYASSMLANMAPMRQRRMLVFKRMIFWFRWMVAMI